MTRLHLTRRQWLEGGAALGAGSLLPGLASAQAAWPSKAIRFVVPFVEQPIVRAILLPFSSAGGMYLIDLFALAM